MPLLESIGRANRNSPELRRFDSRPVYELHHFRTLCAWFGLRYSSRQPSAFIQRQTTAKRTDNTRSRNRSAGCFDDYLQKVYSELLRSANSEHASKIREAQRAWLKHRDTEVKGVDKRSHDDNPLWEQTREDDRKFRLNQLTLARIEELARQLPHHPQNYAEEMYVGSYDAMIDDLAVSLDIGPRNLDVFKAEAHRGIDGRSGTHFSIFGFARITAPRVLAINGQGRDAAKALILGEECILYWDDYAFFLLTRH